MALDIRETPFVKQLAANGTLFDRSFYYQVVWKFFVGFPSLASHIACYQSQFGRENLLDLLIVSLCIMPRHCRNILPAASNSKVDFMLSIKQKTDPQTSWSPYFFHHVRKALALSRALLYTTVSKPSLNKNFGIGIDFFIIYFTRERLYYQIGETSKLTIAQNRPPNSRKSPRFTPHLLNIRPRLHTNRPSKNLERPFLLYVPQSRS